MSWDEYKRMTETLLAFYELSDENKERINLMVDGLKYRSTP